MTTKLDLTADIIDVRDIIERIEELEDEMSGEIPDGTTWGGTEQAEELATLAAVMEELKGNGGAEQYRGDWYPVTLIRDSYFNEYMDEMVADCYDIPKDLPSFMSIVLDYNALQMDYTSIEIDGATYWYR